MARIWILGAAIAATLLPSLALAQASAPLGVERPNSGAPDKGSMTTRDARRAETRQAQKEHELTPAGGGQAPAPKSTKKQSTKTRKQVKEETMDAKKKGELVPAGGGSPKPSQ